MTKLTKRLDGIVKDIEKQATNNDITTMVKYITDYNKEFKESSKANTIVTFIEETSKQEYKEFGALLVALSFLTDNVLVLINDYLTVKAVAQGGF